MSLWKRYTNFVDKAYNIINPSTWRGPTRDSDGTYFYPLSQYNAWNEISYLKAFFEIPELNAVINLKARSESNGVIKLVDKNLKEVQDPFMDVIRNPNWFQAEHEWRMQTRLFHFIFGNEYIYALFPLGFKPGKTSDLFTLPPLLVCPEYNDVQPFFVHTKKNPPEIKYVLDHNGSKQNIDPETIIHLSDNRVCIQKSNDKYLLLGESRMKGLAPAINNIRLAYETRGVMLKHRGALGILSNQSVEGTGAALPVEQKEIDRIQRAYKRYGGLSDQQQIIISSSNLKWQQMTVNPDKLGLYKETEEDFNKILDTYETPSEMFVRSAGSTYENQKQAEKGMYVRTTIPNGNEWVGGLNAKFFIDSPYKLIMDFNHLPIFQEELKVKAEAVGKMITNLSLLLADKQISNEEYRSELMKIGIGDGKVVVYMSGDANQQEVETRQAQASLRGSVGGVQGVLSIQAGVVAGTTTLESAISMLTIIFGFTDEQAGSLLGSPSENVAAPAKSKVAELIKEYNKTFKIQ
jgi:hypothetical protein